MSLANRKVGPEEAGRIAARLRVPAKHGATLRQKLLATVMMLLALGSLVALTSYRRALAEEVRSPLAEKIADADRISYYVLGEDAGPSFRLGPNDRSLKLITHLMLPMTGQDGQPDFAYDEDAEYAYGVVLDLYEIDGEEPVWSREFNIRTRQSKAGGDRFGWRQENSFMLDPVRELTDDRLTRIRLPEAEGRRDRLLRLRLIANKPREQVAGLVRVYVRDLRPVDDKSLRRLALAPGAGRDLVDHVTYHDWAELSEEEREFKLRYIWRRLSAEGEIGSDYQILSVYETGFRLPRGTKTEVEMHPVVPTRWLAFNVIGPAELELRVAEGSADPRELRIHRFGIWGETEALASSGAGSRTLTVPEGVFTYVFSVERPHRHEIEIEVIESEHRVWMTEAERPLRTNDAGNEMLEPDTRRIPVIRLGPEHHESPRWAIEGPDDIATRMLRFDIRVLPPYPYQWWWPPQDPPTPEVDYCFYDRDGAEIECDHWRGRPAVESHFEGLRDGGELVAQAQPQSESEPAAIQWFEIAEPQTLRLVAPEGAAAIVLRQGQQRLLVRGYGYWPEVETLVAEPWREHTAEPTRWRYPPLETRTWFPIRPVNFDALHDDDTIVDLIAQIRLMPRGPGGGGGWGDPWSGADPDWDDRWANLLAGDDGWDPGPWVTVEPRGRHRRRSFLERLDDDAARRLRERWDPSLFTEVIPGRKLVFDLGATGPGAPELHWQLEPEALGRSWSLGLDERELSHEITATRGRWRLPVSEGRHRLTVELEGHDLRQAVPGTVWIDRPVLIASPPVSRRRVVHELTTVLVFPIDKPDQQALTFNVVIYLPRRREQAELEVTVDDGSPPRRTGVPLDKLSVAHRRYAIDRRGASDEHGRAIEARAEVRYVDLEGQLDIALDTLTVPITLGEDVLPGRHEVRVELLDGGRVWVRAFHRGVGDRSLPAASWSESASAADLRRLQGEGDEEQP